MCVFCRPLTSRVEALDRRVRELESRLAAVANSSVLALGPYISVQTTGQPKVVFSGVNVQITNGLGKTDSINGLGNLIVGYDAPQPLSQTIQRCSVGTATIMSEDGPGSALDFCTAVDDPGRPGQKGVLGNSQKTGSHNLVVGDCHMYSQYGGVVFGWNNTINYPWATVTGGAENTAAGLHASVSGGSFNLAGGRGTIINGHQRASISGGRANWAYGMDASISGGIGNYTGNQHASISGGSHNSATGAESHVSGGGGWYQAGNVASGQGSAILGGQGQQANQPGQTIPPIV
jgi:hypothetical protein